MPTDDKIKVVKTDRTKPKGPPPPPPPQPQEIIKSKRNTQNFTPNIYNDDVDEANIPKSGFDFLDNW